MPPTKPVIFNAARLDALVDAQYFAHTHLGWQPPITEVERDLVGTALPAHVREIALCLLRVAAAYPEADYTTTHAGRHTIVVATSTAANAAVAVVLPTGSPSMKSLTRAIRRAFTPPRLPREQPTPAEAAKSYAERSGVVQ